ncbi:MAG: MBOAT family protein [Clostridia bacterium]|nr:MBOAT family protein [Clostridia bacterium]
MLFSSSTFLIFFLPALFILYYVFPKKLIYARNLILLSFSIVFYAFGGVRFLFLLLASILVNYLGGLGCGLAVKKGSKKAFLILAVAVNLALLAYFKYAGFFTEALAFTGIPILKVTLPIGISFFTFQGMSYVIDVYRGDAGMQRDPLKVALYVSLFPQLVAGPIVRYSTVEKEISARSTTIADVSQGLTRFILGFGKKMLLANSMGAVADRVFGLTGNELLSAPLAWVGAIAYTLQIYLDFSAYSDMAIGMGRMLGFHFLENFDYPYTASSVTDFWRRWHISLSTWFRDYVYIPLGGNRRGKGRQIFNLAVVWALTGLWHGANWTFIVWGLYFGAILIVEKFILSGFLKKVPAFFGHLLTLFVVVISWVIFRSDSISDAIRYVGVMFGAGGGDAREAVYYLIEYLPEFVLCIVACLPLKKAVERALGKKAEKSHSARVLIEIGPKLFAAVVFALAYLKLATGSFNPFIYFQF